MRFSNEPTARGDQIANAMREYYMQHRESWWNTYVRKRWRYASDDLMLGLMGVAFRSSAEARAQDAKEAAR